MGKDRIGPKTEILNFGRANLEHLRQELSNIEWRRLRAGKETSGKLDVLKHEIGIVQGHHVKVKGKAGRNRNPE